MVLGLESVCDTKDAVLALKVRAEDPVTRRRVAAVVIPVHKILYVWSVTIPHHIVDVSNSVSRSLVPIPSNLHTTVDDDDVS